MKRNPYKPPPLPVRRPGADEQGVAFIDLVDERAGSPREGERVLSLLREWDRLSDELGREPTIPEFAKHWGVSKATVNRDLQAFRQMFPTERSPGRILSVLWDAVGNEFQHLLTVRVVPAETDE